MSRILYGAPLSPFVRKARLCLQEKAINHELEPVTPFTPPAWYYDINPLGRVPALRDGDLTLADSGVICQYLEDAYPASPRLYGETAAQTANIRWLEKYADYEVAPLATFAIFGERLVRPLLGLPTDESRAQLAVNEGLPPLFGYLEKQLGERDYFVGDRLSMADLALTTQLINMEYGGELLDAERWPNLARHYRNMRELPSMQAIVQTEQWMLQKVREKLAKAEA